MPESLPTPALANSPSTTNLGSRRQAAVAFIFVTVVLDVLALGVIIPVLPDLIKGFLANDTAQAAQVFGLFGTVWALMQFFFSPFLGALSDRFGRRPIILISNFGLGLDYIVMALAPTLGLLFVGRIISGITAASFATAAAYIADVTPPEKRAASYGMIGAAWGLGFVLGPALGGFLGTIDPRLPFWVAAGLTLLNACYGFFVLPESLPKDRRAAFKWSRANPVGSLTLLRAHPGLLGLAGVYSLYALSHYVLQNVFVLYAGYRYQWTQQQVGYTLALVGVCSVIMQGALVRPAVARFGERRSLLAGLFFGAAGFFMYGIAPTGIFFLAAVPVFSFMGLFGPAIQGLMTRNVSPTEQGRLQGANSSIMGIAGVLGPGLFTLVFSYFISDSRSIHIPGAPFFLATLLMLTAMLLAWFVTAKPATQTA